MFQPINEPHAYGYEATKGNRKVEIIRAYTGSWYLFTYTDGVIDRFDATSPVTDTRPIPRFPYQTARKLAYAFLRSI